MVIKTDQKQSAFTPEQFACHIKLKTLNILNGTKWFSFLAVICIHYLEPRGQRLLVLN